MLEFPPLSFPPRKRGPGSRGVAVVTERTSAQRSIPPAGCLGAHEKTAPSVLRRLWWPDVLLVAIQRSVVPGSRRSPGKRGGGKREAQRPRWRRSHRTDLSTAEYSAGRMLGFPPLSFPPRKRGPRNRGVAAATRRTSAQRSIPPARCLGAHEKTAPSVLRRLWWFDVRLAATQSSVVPGSWAPAILPGRENEGRKARGPEAAVWPLSRSGPQHGGLSAGTMIELS